MLVLRADPLRQVRSALKARIPIWKTRRDPLALQNRWLADSERPEPRWRGALIQLAGKAMWGEWVKEGTARCLLYYFRRRKLSITGTPMKCLIGQMKWGRQAEKTEEKQCPLCYCKTRPLALDHIVTILVLTAAGSSALDKQTCTRIYIHKMRRKQYLPCRVTINLEIMYTKCFKCVLCTVTQILVTHNYYIWW